MKTRFNNRDLAHVWSGQQQQAGRGSNMFFEGPSIYSYGRHFEIARWVNGVVLFNSGRYSSSTSKHQAYTRRAVNHADVFTVESMTDHAANVRAYLAAVETARAAALRAVKYGPMYADQALAAATNAMRYADVFKKDVPAKLRAEARRVAALVKAGKLFTAAELARIAASESRRQAAEQKRAERSARQRAEWEVGAPAREMNAAHDAAKRENAKRDAPAMLERWAAGEDVTVYTCLDELPTRLRLKDGRIETSRGAQITERTARALWAALVRGADVAGQVLDNYRVSSWDGATLRVGCHDIARAELERMAEILELPGALVRP